MSDFEYPEFQKFRKEIDKWPEFAVVAAEPAMQDALIFLHGKLPEYPDPPQTGVGFTTQKQRAWFFMSVQDGIIPGWRWVDGTEETPGHPEKTGSARTGNLGRKFTESVTAAPWMVQGELGTNVPYAPWVVGPDFPGEEINGKVMYQARIHQGRWWQFADVVAENMDDAWQEFTDAWWPEFSKNIGQVGG